VALADQPALAGGGRVRELEVLSRDATA